MLLTLTVWGGEIAAQENVDHAGIISAWDPQSVVRGQKLFQIACAPCHGTDGVHTINPQSRPFAVDKFKNGSDPYSLYKTITRGFKNMPSQSWMTPEQRYDVIDFIRETFLKKLIPPNSRKLTATTWIPCRSSIPRCPRSPMTTPSNAISVPCWNRSLARKSPTR
jgi:mono/diheme cytochrome c family protein